MKKLPVYDPALCRSTGVCGVDVDQDLIDASADVDRLKSNGAEVERFNLSRQPMALFESPPVLEAAGLQEDLRRAGIEPRGWIINNNLLKTQARAPLLIQRAA